MKSTGCSSRGAGYEDLYCLPSQCWPLTHKVAKNDLELPEFPSPQHASTIIGMCHHVSPFQTEPRQNSGLCAQQPSIVHPESEILHLLYMSFDMIWTWLLLSGDQTQGFEQVKQVPHRWSTWSPDLASSSPHWWPNTFQNDMWATALAAVCICPSHLFLPGVLSNTSQLTSTPKTN